MPQSYTIGDDNWQGILNDSISGQTFRPETLFVVRWIDLWLNKKPVLPSAVLQIFFAGGDHLPFGDCLSRDRYIIASETLPGGIHHVRFSMQPFLLDPIDYYCLQVGYYPPVPPTTLKWRYDAGDATYPRGLRIQSDDHGENWTLHVNDDHKFVIWGTPPVPAPPPEPPITNASILAIEKTPTETGMQLVVTTNVPCHLYAAYTLDQPLKHPNTRIVRGLSVPWDTRWCFINWTQNEQTEEGDTIIHTFTKEPWTVCETRYFVFRGKVDDEWIPSASPIFTIHCPYHEWTRYYYTDPHPEVVCVDGHASHFHAGSTWDHILHGGGTSTSDQFNGATCQIACSNPENTYLVNSRTLLLFDTREFPTGKEIISAQIELWSLTKGQTPGWGLDNLFKVNIVSSFPVLDTAVQIADYLRTGSTLMSNSVTWANWPTGHIQVAFPLNAAGIARITPEGISKFALKEVNYDIGSVAPPWQVPGSINVQLHTAETGFEGERPRLKVVYRG